MTCVELLSHSQFTYIKSVAAAASLSLSLPLLLLLSRPSSSSSSSLQMCCCNRAYLRRLCVPNTLNGTQNRIAYKVIAIEHLRLYIHTHTLVEFEGDLVILNG